MSIFDRAYMYYRKKWDSAALKVIGKLDENEPRVMELKAQIFYRQEKFEDSLQLFSKLIRVISDEHDETRLSNLIAVKACLQAKGTHQDVDIEQLETFEQMYNASFYLLAQNLDQNAIFLLDKALDAGEKTLIDEGLSKEEIETELAPVLAQKGYALQKSGSLKEALKIYQRVLKIKSLDQKTRDTIMSNLGSDFVRFGKKFRPKKSGQFHEESKDRIKKNRRRKTKLPTNYNPDEPPDPERWLPRQERSTYKKKGKKYREREIGRGTQGFASSASNSNIDYSKASPSGSAVDEKQQTSPSPRPTPPQHEGPRQQRPGQQAKKAKKKKGGGKW